MGTITMLPLYMGYDSLSYFISKFSWLLPLGTIRWIVDLITSYFDYTEQEDSVVTLNDAMCINCSKIICARHKKSGCEECLFNSDLVFLT